MSHLTQACIAIAGSLGFFTTTANAAPELYVSAYGQGPGSQQTASSGPVSQSDSATHQFGSGMARAGADFGVLRNYAEATAIAGSSNFNNAVLASTTARWQDDLLFNAAGLTGSPGSVTVKFRIDGTLAASQPQFDPDQSQTRADASYGMSILGSGVVHSGGESRFADGTRTFSGSGPFLNVEQTATLPFTFGTAFTLKLEVSASSTARTQFGGSALADLENTTTWGGFITVRDSQGQVVNNYTFSSASGTNFINPIPEPNTALLILGAAAGLLARRNRQL